jgi:hypothetical protein
LELCRRLYLLWPARLRSWSQPNLAKHEWITTQRVYVNSEPMNLAERHTALSRSFYVPGKQYMSRHAFLRTDQQLCLGFPRNWQCSTSRWDPSRPPCGWMHLAVVAWHSLAAFECCRNPRHLPIRRISRLEGRIRYLSIPELQSSFTHLRLYLSRSRALPASSLLDCCVAASYTIKPYKPSSNRSCGLVVTILA